MITSLIWLSITFSLGTPRGNIQSAGIVYHSFQAVRSGWLWAQAVALSFHAGFRHAILSSVRGTHRLMRSAAFASPRDTGGGFHEKASDTGVAPAAGTLESRVLLTVSLPPGFVDTPVTDKLFNPTAMAFAPTANGSTQLFVTEQTGALRVVKNGTLLDTPFVTLTVDSAGERGLLGVAIDPNYASNHFVYVYYTATTPVAHNRISRFVADGDVAAGGTGGETVLFDLDPLSSATNHNGGAVILAAMGSCMPRWGRMRRRRMPNRLRR